MSEGFEDLNLREREILRHVVQEYILNAQPVSSLMLAEKVGIGCSSATIRSIFSDLDIKKYLFAPHRSSGRIPTEKSFRFFVENLVEKRMPLDDTERTLIQKEYLKSEFRMEEILEVTCRILSMLTNSTGVVLGPEPDQAVLKHLELIDMGQDELLIVLVTRSGTVYSKTIFLEKRIPADYLHKISRALNEIFKGNDLREIKNSLKEKLELGSRELLEYYPIIAKTILDNFDLVKGEDDLYTYGMEKLISGFDPKDLQTSNVIGNLFQSRHLLKDIFKQTVNLDDVSIVIDGDRDQRLNGISIVSASYKMGEKRIGSIGIVGPNRMDYIRVISIVDYLSLLVSGMFTRMSN